jgi:hypothetical protein
MPSESRRRLDPQLRQIDMLLDLWALWSKRELEKLGYGRSMSQKLIEWHELGVAPESYTALRSSECPDGAMLMDRMVARLPKALHVAICVQYFIYAPVEAKAKAAHTSVPTFRRNLDRALWALHHAMAVLEIELDVDANIKNL